MRIGLFPGAGSEGYRLVELIERRGHGVEIVASPSDHIVFDDLVEDARTAIRSMTLDALVGVSEGAAIAIHQPLRLPTLLIGTDHAQWMPQQTLPHSHFRLVHSDDDPLVPVEQIEELLDRSGLDLAEHLTQIPSRVHPYDAESEEFCAALDKWLEWAEDIGAG